MDCSGGSCGAPSQIELEPLPAWAWGAVLTLLRGLGSPFTVLKDGRISNQVRLKIANRTETDQSYLFELVDGAELWVNGRLYTYERVRQRGAGGSACRRTARRRIWTD